MPLMNWTNDFSVSIKEVDNQHKKLIDLLNNLHDAMKVGKGKEAMATVFNELVQYTSYHFATEEQLFKTHGYLAATPHIREHEALTKQALELKDRLSRGEPVLSGEVMNFLKDWLNKHIIGSDKEYGPFLNAKGVQ